MLAGSDSLLSGAFAIGHADATRDIRAALVAERRADAGATAPIPAAAFGERAAKIGELVRDYRFEDALAALREVTRR